MSILSEIKQLSPDSGESVLASYQTAPKLFLNNILGVTKTWSGQDEILEAVPRHRRIVVPSGHALGKDFISSCLIPWFLLCFRPSIVIATAPSDRQVGAVIWGELGERYYNAKLPLGGRFLDKYWEMDEKSKHYAIGFTTKDVAKTQGKFQGFHAPHVMIIFSEAQAIEKSIWDQADSLMTTGDAHFLAIGNPLVSYGSFYEAIQPSSGWHMIRLDCEKSPNVLERREVIPGLCSHIWVDEMAKKHGRDSPIFKAKVNGIAPRKSLDAFISAEWMEWANTRGMDLLKPIGSEILGVDPASYGSNKTVIAGRRGPVLTRLDKYDRKSTMETTGLIVNLLNSGAACVFLDVTGVGAGIYDRLVELGHGSRVIPVNFGGRPIDPDFLEPGQLAPSVRYLNIGTQMYDNVAKLLESRKMAMPYDEDANLQFVSRQMKTRSDGKMMLEPKDLFKKRGYDSPDEADAIVLAYSDPSAAGAAPEPFADAQEDKTLGEIFE